MLPYEEVDVLGVNCAFGCRIGSTGARVSVLLRPDGAGRWRQFTHMTFPLIMPFFTINMVLSFKSALAVFDQVVALTNGGPGTATQSISFLIFRNGFQGGEYAYQTANGIVYFILVLVVSFAQFRFFRSKESTE